MTQDFRTTVVIPARYGSERFPGKPLALLKGRPVLLHVVDIARAVQKTFPRVSFLVATDDTRIQEFCENEGVPSVMTPADCRTGTDRAMAAVDKAGGEKPDFIVNLQGDSPFTPPSFVLRMIETYAMDQSADIVTPVVQLTWAELDSLRESKKTTPLSGTTAVLSADNFALWFSKTILPTLRGEERLRAAGDLSPVYRHIGLYGYSYAALGRFISLPPSRYEILEGLEQLRALEDGMRIRCVPVDYEGRPSMSGIDSPEDLERAEKLLS